jgi:NADH-quinone oxidoreductase subunit A
MIIFPVALVVAAKILGPYNPNPVKNSTFECGQIPIGKSHVRFTIQYLPYAMIYAIFGALAIFLLLAAPAIARLNVELLSVALSLLIVLTLALFGAAISLRSVRGR